MERGSVVTVVPFFNRRRTVQAALASVAAQATPTDRLIVVDDGSSDGGADAVVRWLKRHLAHVEWQLIVQSNAGVSAARNRGLGLAGEHDFIAFLDSDDMWPSDFLTRTAGILAKHPAAVAVSCDRRFAFADGSPAQWYDSSRIAACPALWMLEYGANIASCTLFRSAAIKRQGGFDPQLRTGEDGALFMPLSLAGPWLHAPGKAVTFQHGQAEQIGEHGNLSLRYRENRKNWAALYEDFFVRGPGRPFLVRPSCKRLLARAWYHAGCELLARRAPADAARCFRRAIAWNPRRAKYYSRLLRAWGRSLIHASASGMVGGARDGRSQTASLARPLTRGPAALKSRT